MAGWEDPKYPFDIVVLSSVQFDYMVTYFIWFL